jgi:hypothetical protein
VNFTINISGPQPTIISQDGEGRNKGLVCCWLGRGPRGPSNSLPLWDFRPSLAMIYFHSSSPHVESKIEKQCSSNPSNSSSHSHFATVAFQK